MRLISNWESLKKKDNIECVQPQDRLITLLMDLATSQLDAYTTIMQYKKRNRRDSRVLERLRVTQAMFLVVQEAKGLTLPQNPKTPNLAGYELIIIIKVPLLIRPLTHWGNILKIQKNTRLIALEELYNFASLSFFTAITVFEIIESQFFNNYRFNHCSKVLT